MSELIELIKKNTGVNSHSKVGGIDIHLTGDDAKRLLELLIQLEKVI